MDADTRRRIEMGQRIFHFSRQHPAGGTTGRRDDGPLEVGDYDMGPAIA